MIVITRVTLDEGTGPDWDAAMRDRMETAESVDGWLSGQILMPLEGLNERLIVGAWRSRAAWEAWHNDPTFQQTRDRLAELGSPEGETAWHEVIYHAPGG